MPQPTPQAHASGARIAAPAEGRVQRNAHRLRNTWRWRVRPRWHEYRPLVLLILGISVLVLGTIGFEQLPSEHYDFFDSFYRAITLFAFGGAVAPPVPPTLQIARILAPILTGYAAVGTILVLTREQARVAGIRLFVRDHVIVAGLGASGARIAYALGDREPVVVIESDPANERVATAPGRGVRVLRGLATDHGLLRRAGIAHARSLVVLCGQDGTNVDVAAAATEAVPHRHKPLTIFVHLRDLDLWSSLAAEGPALGSGKDSIRIEYFNVFATGAQLMLEHDPPFAPPAPVGPPHRPHVLVVGLEGVGEQIVLQTARMWRSVKRRAVDELRITFTGPDADADLARLRSRYPAIDRYCVLGARPLAIESAEFQSGAAMTGEDGACDVTHAYVCVIDEGDALVAALALHARADTTGVPVTVALEEAGNGVGIVLAAEEGRFADIRPFGVLAAATSDELLLRGTNELLARAQHAQWLRNEMAKGHTAAQNPNIRPWQELEESQREENRRFADDVHTKLMLSHCMLVPMPLRDPAEPQFQWRDADLEQLSQHEHTRWMSSKLADGWRYGEPRDDANKIHDQIKPWAKLDEENRDRDRDAVRELPDILELAGFRIQKLGAPIVEQP
jgi:preprotein translocase subunit Sss1